jgi:hypothetical protein
MKKWLAGIWLLVLMIIIGGFFWFNQLIYSLPTPVPASYKVILPGNKINFSYTANFENPKPVFLHFFNPDCPCSRFNVDHFNNLVKAYSDQVNFLVVMMTDKSYTEKEVQERFGIKVPVIRDLDIAEACGVYSTPQAVVLKPNHTLYYRGNYNRSRYCTDEKTNYAKIAIEGVLENHDIKLEAYASKSYGCTLPNCSN